MSSRRDFLGRGKYGCVHGTSKYAIKQINDEDVFNAETDAYRSLNKVQSLRNRIPILYGIDPDK